MNRIGSNENSMSANVKVVNLVGAINISNVETFAQEIRAALGEERMVLLSLSQATDIDLAGVQLLYAARKAAVGQGRPLYISGGVPERIAQRLHRAGFAPTVIMDGRELDAQLIGFPAGEVSDA
jgi:anti-anti-sigma regulatory factor